jgi:competence protein ComEA
MTRPPAPTQPAVDVTVEVHVAGWVVSPGVVTVDEGAIVAEAVEAAGGLRPGANSGSLNLAAPVGAGDQIVVPGPDGVLEGDGGTSDGLVSLSRATASELETLPGVGPVLAKRIVAYREEHGPLESVEDLLDVPGIGESKLASIRDLVRP